MSTPLTRYDHRNEPHHARPDAPTSNRRRRRRPLGVVGMTRKPTSVNLETDHIEWMERENINRSDLMNELIDRYRSGRSQIDDAVREMRIEQLESEVDSLENEKERKREELQRLKEEHVRAEDHREDMLPRALDALGDIPADKRTPDNPAVANWADKLSMTETELLAEYEDNGGDAE